jgi:hypothetical protein
MPSLSVFPNQIDPSVGAPPTDVQNPALNHPDPSDSSRTHSAKHQEISDALHAIETKVGADNSTDATSLDAKLGRLLGLLLNVGLTYTQFAAATVFTPTTTSGGTLGFGTYNLPFTVSLSQPAVSLEYRIRRSVDASTLVDWTPIQYALPAGANQTVTAYHFPATNGYVYVDLRANRDNNQIALSTNVISVGTPEIGNDWTDRRPIGQLILTDNGGSYNNPNNLNSWNHNLITAPGVNAAQFQADVLAAFNTAIQRTKEVHGQGIIVWDVQGVGMTANSHHAQWYLGDPRFLNPARAGLTTQTAYAPYVIPTSTLGQQGVEPAMDQIVDQCFAAIRNAGLIPGVCLRAEKAHVTTSPETFKDPSDNVTSGYPDVFYTQVLTSDVGHLPYTVPAGELNPDPAVYANQTNGDDQVFYDTTANQLADLDAKLTYAYNRWGCRIFYVDSNANAVDVQPSMNPDFAPAYIYTQLRQRHPDCLICPEEFFTNPVQISGLSGGININDPSYQYERVTCRYTELRNPWMSPILGSDEIQNVRSTFDLVLLSDAVKTDTQTGDPSTGYVVGVYENRSGTADPTLKANLVNQLQQNQTILLFECWYQSPGYWAAKWLQEAAHVNGF